MSKIPALAAPGTVRPWWMAAVVTGQTTNARLPLSHLGALPKGAIVLSLAAYVADTASTSDADPGSGNLRWDNATQASATEIYIDDQDAAATDNSALWATLNAGGFLYLYKPDDLDVWQQWQIATVTDDSGYLKLGVTLVASNGSFSDDDDIILTLQQPSPAPGVDRSAVTVATSSSGVLAIDYDAGDYFTVALSEAITSWSFTNMPGAGTGVTLGLLLTQDTTDRAVAWPSSFNWGDGVTAPSMPTGSGAQLFLIITTFDNGTTWDASARERA